MEHNESSNRLIINKALNNILNGDYYQFDKILRDDELCHKDVFVDLLKFFYTYCLKKDLVEAVEYIEQVLNDLEIIIYKNDNTEFIKYLERNKKIEKIYYHINNGSSEFIKEILLKLNYYTFEKLLEIDKNEIFGEIFEKIKYIKKLNIYYKNDDEIMLENNKLNVIDLILGNEEFFFFVKKNCEIELNDIFENYCCHNDTITNFLYLLQSSNFKSFNNLKYLIDFAIKESGDDSSINSLICNIISSKISNNEDFNKIFYYLWFYKLNNLSDRSIKISLKKTLIFYLIELLDKKNIGEVLTDLFNDCNADNINIEEYRLKILANILKYNPQLTNFIIEQNLVENPLNKAETIQLFFFKYLNSCSINSIYKIYELVPYELEDIVTNEIRDNVFSILDAKKISPDFLEFLKQKQLLNGNIFNFCELIGLPALSMGNENCIENLFWFSNNFENFLYYWERKIKSRNFYNAFSFLPFNEKDIDFLLKINEKFNDLNEKNNSNNYYDMVIHFLSLNIFLTKGAIKLLENKNFYL
jgi:hypothetical protein